MQAMRREMLEAENEKERLMNQLELERADKVRRCRLTPSNLR
jgi:hypothetical protein